VTLLHFRGGVIGTIDNSRKAVYGYDQRAEVFGSAGKITTNNVYRNEAIISTAREIRRDLPLNFFVDRYATSYVDELRAFVDAILNDKPVSVTGVDGRIPVAMAAAASKSFKENRPVKLAEIAA
jgi:myo-inositol 2-dehydrogenase/D-chiro-inositol 1-dehydrogenase